MDRISRRRFLERTATAAAAASIAGAAPAANDKIVIAIAGLRIRGKHLAADFVKLPDVEIAAVCDVDPEMFGPTVKLIEGAGRKSPATEVDLRRLLDRKDIDALVVATPDHWHAHATIWACQAGKDVYVEKPISHNVAEGRRMVAAARRCQRVVQAGTQRRSDPLWAGAIAKIKAGALGKVSMVRTWTAHEIEDIGHKQECPAPPGVAYDLWLGPAPRRPFHPSRFHYHWHWFWDYGTGQLGNNGIHFIDVARWALDLGYPEYVASGGGNIHFDNDMETPDTQLATFDYPGVVVVWEHRMWSAHPIEGQRFGIAFYGGGGTMVLDNGGWQILSNGKVVEKSPPARSQTLAHLQNFVDCVRSRKQPKADVEIGHISSAVCHLGNIAHRTGRRLRFDAAAERFVNDEEANRLLTRAYASGWELPAV